MTKNSAIPPKTAAPKYEELAQLLRAQIQSGVLRPGERLPTLAEMRQTQNASRPTVEKAYSILADEGLIERQRSMSAVVSAPRRKTVAGVLGLCGFEGIGSWSYWQDLVDGINQQTRAIGAQVLLLPYHVGDGWEKVDGVILCDWLNTYYQRSIPSQIPVVSLFVEQQKWQHSSVAANESSGIAQAVSHLLELGHERIAFLHGRDQGVVMPRLQSFKATLQNAGIKVRKNWCRALRGKNDYAPQFLEAGYRDVLSWIGENGDGGWNQIGCTALLCHNDETAIGAMQAFTESGIRVPHDVSVIGFDGTSVGEYSSPRLTSVEIPLRRMGQAAVEILERQINADEIIIENRVLPTRLVVRHSTVKNPR